MKTLLLAAILYSLPSFSFFSKDVVHEPNFTLVTEIVKSKAQEIAQKVKTLYKNELGTDGKNLIINFNWNDNDINAYATFDMNDNPVINITGGMLSHDYMSLDGIGLVLCHEVGHFLGGSPKKLRGRSTKRSWSSAEGQADYYATANCMKKLLPLLPNNYQNMEFSDISWQIDQICITEECKRMAMASLSVARVYAAIKFYKKPLSLVSPSHNEVYQTNLSHPDPQCRLDTMLAGIKCQNSLDIIFKSSGNLNECNHEDFKRPNCWYFE